MSSADIRDILQISTPKETLNKPKSTEKRPEGLSRELYQLIGSVPPVTLVKPTLRSKLYNKQKATPWVEHTFSNPARTDHLLLTHWVKKREADNTEEYEFAKFNKKVEVIQYDEDEYQGFLTDSDWSKEETDYLFELCKEFDLRFPVIEDRYAFPKGKPRTLEDLKDRYYTVCRKMIMQGKLTGFEGDRAALAHQYQFDKAKEIERKQALTSLFYRSKNQVLEEEALLVEAKRIECNESRLAKDRESLLNSLQLEQIHQMPSTPNTPSSTPTAHSHLSPGSIGITGGTASNLSMEAKKKRKIQEEIKKGRKLSAHPEGTETPLEIKREKLTPGVYVRSQKLPIVKPTMQPKALKVLEELGIGPRPVMPTAQVCQRFEHLQNSILNLFELKKLVDKTEMEHKVKIQKGGIGIVSGRVNKNNKR
ncbi:hypothetical protein BY458DRAFT_517582 [Sporodiniella umbellata]|nr:hypothetical protein BY458DRAFT_517582 [Sporodiniella umbellata]